MMFAAQTQEAGRNDPCPCGSGKKYKKCCIANEAATPLPPAPNHEEQIALLVNTGGRLRLEGRYDEALAMFNKALALNPRFGLTYFNRGMVYYSLKQVPAMQADFERAAQLTPEHAEMFQKMAIPYVHLEQYDKAVAVLEKALQINPASEEAWLWLVRAHYQQGDDETAYGLLTRAVKQLPHSAGLKLAHALYLSRVPASHAAIAEERVRFIEGLDALMAQGVKLAAPEHQLHFMPAALAYHGANDKPLMQQMAAFMLAACPELGGVAPHCLPGAARKPGPMRIGIVSESAHTKTATQFITGMMDGFKRDAGIEVYLITNSPEAEPLTQQLMRAAHGAIRFGHSLPEARLAIANAELDALIYLEVGIYHMSYLLSFARLARIQCAWGGFPVTTGVPNVDYFITSRGAEPEDPAAHYTETPLLFERNVAVFTRSQLTGEAKPKEAYGLPGGDARSYLCPVLPHKLHPDMDDIFAEILARDAQARIVLFRSNQSFFQKNLEARLKRRIPEKDHARLVFTGFLAINEFLHVLTLADAVLDTLHYSFGTTAFHCYSVGVPFVTHRGEFLRGRGGGAYMYGRIDMNDMIVDTKEQYVELALKTAKDKAFHGAMAAKIRERAGIFFDDADVAPELGERLKTIFRQQP